MECYNCHRKGHFVRKCRSPKDTRRNGAAEPQRRNVLVETSTSNALPIEQVKTPRSSVKTIETSIPTTTHKTAIPKPKAKTVVTKPHSPPRRKINRSPSPKASNFPPKVTAVKVPQVNPAKGVQGKWEWKPKCPLLDHVSRNTSESMTLKRFDYNDALGRSKSELKFNLFSVSHMCDKKNNVLFTDTECLVLSPEFKLPDENQVLLRVLRENNMYNIDLKNIVPSGDLTCLFAKATLDESNLWHRRLGHINFKTMYKLVKGNLVRGLPSKVFKNNHTCVACKKGKQHTTSCKTKPVSSVNQLLQRVLVTKPQNKTPYALLLGRTPSIGFIRPFGCPVTILNTLDPLGKFDGKVDEGFLVGYSNTDGDIAFEVKEPEFEGRKPKSEVHVSPSSSAQTKKHDDKTKREAKGKSPVESSIGYRNLIAEFEDFSDNSTNEVKEYQEKDKIGTKPDQIKKEQEAWRSQEKSRAVSVNKGRKTKQDVKRKAGNAKFTKAY
nr:ribonuclease H-like domain-containing protein [Tanacetum cinerariifolium]